MCEKGSHPNVHQLGRNPTLVNRVSVGGKGEYVMLNDGDVISIAPDAALPMYTVKVTEVAVPKPPAKAAAQKPSAKVP